MTASGDGDGSPAYQVIVIVQEEEVELDIQEEETAGQVVIRLLTRSPGGEDRAAEGWSLWAVPSRKGRGWWIEEEIIGFAPAILDSTTSILPHATSLLRLLPPETVSIPLSIDLPNTTSDKALQFRYPVLPKHIFSAVLADIIGDLALPVVSGDLVGRSRSRALSVTSQGGKSNAGSIAEEDEIHWKVEIQDPEGGIYTPDPSDIIQPAQIAALRISVDDTWLLEKDDTSGDSTAKRPGQAVREVRRDAETTGSPVPRSPTYASYSASPANRLSGLYQGWHEANEHPAPPPSRESSFASANTDQHRNMRARRNVRPTSIGSSLEALFTEAPPSSSAPASPLPVPATPQPVVNTSPPTVTSPTFLSLSAASSSGLARLLPQLTGSSTGSAATTSKNTGGWGKKLSMTSLGSWVVGSGSQETAVDATSVTVRSPTRSISSISEVSERPLETQSTGGLWGWWAGSGSAEEGTAQALSKPIKQAKRIDGALVKALLALRVVLSTASIAWINQFLDIGGVDALIPHLRQASFKAKEGGDVNEQVIMETTKCLRAIMNTDRGFSAVLDRPPIISHLALSLQTPNVKLRIQITDLLSALCVLSAEEGQPLVLDAHAEAALLTDETYRFEWLVRSLIPLPGEEDDMIWEWRAAAMGLFNALAGTSDLLEERCDLRGELRRRGLNEVLESFRERPCPDTFKRQMELYLDETGEDFQAARKVHLSEALTPLQAASNSLLQTAEEFPATTRALHDVVESCREILQNASDSELPIISLELLSQLAQSLSRALDVDDIATAITGFMVQARLALPDAFAAPGDVLPESQGDREQLRTDNLKDELAEARETIVDKDQAIADQAKHLAYLERALEIVRSRMIPSELTTESNEAPSSTAVDAHTVASQAVASFVRQAEEIKKLKEENEALRTRIEAPHAIRQRIVECDEMDTSETTVSAPATTADITYMGMTTPSFSPAPPSPPPPPLPPYLSAIISLPPPPPPPPPPPLPLLPPPATATAKNRFLKDLPLASPPPPPPAPPPPPPPPPPPSFPSAAASKGLPSTATETKSPISPIISVNSSTRPPPPPPPPPIGLRPPLSRQTTIKPTPPAGPKLKPFFWSKMTPMSSQNTVWQTLPTDPVQNSEDCFDDLVEIFRVDQPATKQKSAVTASRAHAVISILDITRSNNVGIMLARLRLSPSRIKTAILECDEETLSVDDLAMLTRMLPSSEESERLRTFDGDITKLAKPDMFLREISTIPHLKDRLEAMVFKQRFGMHMAEISPDLKILREGMREIRSSERFKEVLELVLRLGNRLNGGTFRGNAMGFKMGDLLKMKETRTSQPKCPTLLHYLASALLKVNAQLILFSEEMTSLEAAARLDLSELVNSVETLHRGLTHAKSTLGLHKPSDSDNFISTQTPFIKSAQPQIDKLLRMRQELRTESQSTLAFYGEPKESKIEDLFGIIAGFSAGLQKAAADITRHLVTVPKGRKAAGDVGSRVNGQARLLAAAAAKVVIDPAEQDEKPSTNDSAKGHLLGVPSDSSQASTLKALPTPSLLLPNSDKPGSKFGHSGTMARRGTVRGTLSKGELDEAIRSIHGGVTRRERGTMSRSGGVRLSKMFLDGKGSVKVSGEKTSGLVRS